MFSFSLARLSSAALIAALADPDRDWDEVVIGEYERAFYGGQYVSMAPHRPDRGDHSGVISPGKTPPPHGALVGSNLSRQD